MYEKIQIYLGASRRRSNKTVTVTDRKSKQGRREGEEREKKFHKRRKRRKKARVASVDQAEAAWHA